MPFWQFFLDRLIGWIGHALLVQPSKTAHKVFYSHLYFNFPLFFLNMKPLSVEMACLLGIQNEIQAVCKGTNTNTNNKVLYRLHLLISWKIQRLLLFDSLHLFDI